MAKTANLFMRVDPQIKAKAQTIYLRYGLSVTDAINVFLHQSINVGGFPFDLRPGVPAKEPTEGTSAETANSLKGSRGGKRGRPPRSAYSAAKERKTPSKK
jgi:DNA-damage-inducible protein J